MYSYYNNADALDKKCKQITNNEVISALREAMSHSYYGVKMPNPTIDALSAEDIKAIKMDLAQKQMGVITPQSALKSDSHRFSMIMSRMESYNFNKARI